MSKSDTVNCFWVRLFMFIIKKEKCSVMRYVYKQFNYL